ncbi:MAG: hypothetical protein K1X75_12280 [Leptospirales bacterium]|nr:hypothetical protein [Leptospirales bacterium]
MIEDSEGPAPCCLAPAGQQLLKSYVDGVWQRCNACGRRALSGSLEFEASCASDLQFSFWLRWETDPPAGAELADFVQSRRPYYGRSRRGQAFRRID